MPLVKKLLSTGKKVKNIKLSDFRKATADLDGDIEIVFNYEFDKKLGEEMGWLEVESVELAELEFSGKKVLNINQQY